MASPEAQAVDVGRPPNLSDLSLDGHGAVSRLWQGVAGAGGVGIEISEVQLNQAPTARRLRDAWRARRGGSSRPVIVFASTPEGVLVCGPDGSPPPVASLSPAIAGQIFRRVLDQPPVQASLAAMSLISRAQGSGSVPGFRNRSLVSTHFVTNVIRRERRREWTDAAGAGRRALGEAGEPMLRALGYDLKAIRPKEYQLQDDGQAVAVVHVYDDGVNLDRVLAGQSAPPASHALQRAEELRVGHALLVAGSLLRIYSLRAEESLDEGAASVAFVEFDTTLLPDEYAPLLGALAAPDALRPDGRLSRIREESGRYAVGLRERFTKRLYEQVVDQVVRGLWDAARSRGLNPLPDEEQLYRATLVLLFRLLFLLYAEDRNLLPMQNAEYRRRSITHMVIAAAQTVHDPQRHFDPTATSLWTDLRQLFSAVRAGNADWGVPPYDGGLFEDDGLDGGLLAAIELPNKVVGESLHQLGWDETDAGSGKIDFGDLGVRQIGTVYEGLLTYEIAFAASNLRVDKRAEGEPYVTAQPGESVEIPSGTPHVRSPQGGRKATGSYYTPAFAVQRLTDSTVRPALDEHLAALEGQVASADFFDIRVCDAAMGSGHFLVAALDMLTDGFAAYLARHPVRSVSDELAAARERLAEVGRSYGAPDLGEQVADIDLLRRLALKRCIYGVDYNPMAVELARLGLWLHSLVPGLPLSYLGHTLQYGNSLIGMGAHSPAVGLFAHQAEEQARNAAASVASITDLELGDLDESRRRETDLKEATRGLQDLYDLITAEPLMERDTGWALLQAESIVFGALAPDQQSELRAAREAAADLGAFHWRLAFPEVFLRDRPGFDVVLGNPPWEEATMERLHWFVRHIPGIKAVTSAQERDRRIAEFEATYSTIRERYVRELGRKAALRRYLQRVYKLTRSGNPDLYKAFAERFLDLVRDGGRIGVVLPRTAFAGDGTAPFREALFTSARELNLDAIVNNRQWMFPDVHPQYTVMLTSGVIDRGVLERTISVSGPSDSRTAFDLVDHQRVVWTLEDLRRALPDLAIPLLPNRRMATIFQRLSTVHPRFASTRLGWHPVPWIEFNVTIERKSGLLKEYGRVDGEWWPVYGGRSFDLWEPELWRKNGQPEFVLEPSVGLAELQRKRLRSSVWKVFPRSALQDSGSLPMHRPRILFRDVSRATDSRTVRAALVPPHVFAHNKAPTIIWPSGDARDEAYLLAVMASVPFDWLARRRVEVNLNLFILNSLAVPRPPRSDPRWQRSAEVAARLASVDQRYRNFAADNGVATGALEDAERAAMIAELDAVVAHLYGLSRDELEEMFEDFPATTAGVSPGRRADVLEWYDRWAT